MKSILKDIPAVMEQIEITVLGFYAEPIPTPPYAMYFVKGANLQTGEIVNIQCMYHHYIAMIKLWYVPDLGIRPLAVRLHYREVKVIIFEEIYT